MIEFHVEYIKALDSLSISATIWDDSACTSFELPEDKEKLARGLEALLNCLLNSPRSQIIHKEPLIKRILHEKIK